MLKLMVIQYVKVMIGSTTILWLHGNAQISISCALTSDESVQKPARVFMARLCELLEFENDMVIGNRWIRHFIFEIWGCLTSLNLQYCMYIRNTWWKVLSLTVYGTVFHHGSLMIMNCGAWFELSVINDLRQILQNCLKSYPHSM